MTSLSENGNPVNRFLTNVDPIQLMIWGALLIIYGVITVVQTLRWAEGRNTLYLVTPNLILTFFGVLVAAVGYRSEKENRKRGN